MLALNLYQDAVHALTLAQRICAALECAVLHGN